MRTRQLAGLAAAAAVGLLGSAAAGTAAADTNINVHSPTMKCDTAPLSADGATTACVARQGVEQEVLKTGTTESDVINRLDIAVPATLGG